MHSVVTIHPASISDLEYLLVSYMAVSNSQLSINELYCIHACNPHRQEQKVDFVFRKETKLPPDFGQAFLAMQADIDANKKLIIACSAQLSDRRLIEPDTPCAQVLSLHDYTEARVTQAA